MWVKLENDSYVDTDTGSTVETYTVKDDYANVDSYAVRLRQPNFNRGIPANVQSGYSTVEEATAALDDLMSSVDFVQAQPPVTDEETADASTVDTDSGKE